MSDNPRSDAEIFTEFDRLVRTQVGLPPHFRALFLVGNSAKYITQHSAMTAFDENPTQHLLKKRDSIIEVFSRIEFLIDELIKIHVIGINHHRESEFFNLFEGMGIGRKIGILFDWDLITKELRDNVRKLLGVRNAVAHDVSLHDAIYNNEHILTAFNTEGWDKFKVDLQNAWGELREAYRVQQNNEDWDLLIAQIEAWQNSQSTETSN